MITGKTNLLGEVESSARTKLGNLGMNITNGSLQALSIEKTFIGTSGVSEFNITFRTKITPLNKTNFVQITFPSYYIDSITEKISCLIGNSKYKFDETSCWTDTFNPRLLHILGPKKIEFQANDTIEIHIQGI